jgi:hypothetical protein
VFLFRAPTAVVVLVISAWIVAATVCGVLFGRRLRTSHEGLREPVGAIQAALLAFVAVLFAFGLAMGVDRFEGRREALVVEANAIGTTYLRAELLPEPQRSRSLRLLQEYTDARIELSDTDVDSTPFDNAVSKGREIQRSLWSDAGTAVAQLPNDTAPRLYLESLNQMIDADTARVSALGNRIPLSVLTLHIVAGGLAMGVLGLFMGLLGRGARVALAGAVLVVLILLVIIDLDRPRRGFVVVPRGPLTALRASMNEVPAAGGPILN